MRTKTFYLVQLCAFFIFIGRAYQFYFFGAPFRNILWDESLLSPIVEGVFNTSWDDYATNKNVNYWIDSVTKVSSIILFLSALVSIFWNKINNVKLKKNVISTGLSVLVFMGICLVKSKNYDILQFFELAIQFAVPLLLLFLKNNSLSNYPKQLFALKIIIALVFVSHGLFAMGVIYVPGHFIDMSIQILGVNETISKQFLFIVGLLDVVASILIFVPKISKYAFYYIIAWGIITALARVISGFNHNFILRSLHNLLYLTVYRLPHGLLPLVALILNVEYNKIIKYQQVNTLKK
ncbi:MAG: hypothetical protein HRT67_04210 [Flavobacteriaceae bacterium]|nr:hypothetical protein [Flavobacteriaceae bacterium]